MDEAFGIKTYDATTVGWVPTPEREIERFVLGARPAVDPAKSEERLIKALHQDGPPSPPAPEPEEKRGLFGRKRS
jgi:hypothetical protein